MRIDDPLSASRAAASLWGRTGDGDTLRKFLHDRLELSSPMALSVSSEVISDGSSHCEIDLDRREVKDLMKTLKLEARASEAEALEANKPAAK